MSQPNNERPSFLSVRGKLPAAIWRDLHASTREARGRPAVLVVDEDRDADMWEPLLAVADVAGSTWPERARVTAVTHVTDSKESTPSLGIRLLADLRTVFGLSNVMSTDAILSALHAMPEAPWSEVVGGKPLNPRGLARRLHQYGVSPKVVRIGETTSRGYAREDLADAWSRYLSSPHHESVTNVTNETDAGASGASGTFFRNSSRDSSRGDFTEPNALNLTPLTSLISKSNNLSALKSGARIQFLWGTLTTAPSTLIAEVWRHEPSLSCR
jgi:hypothetical protein